ncbi:anti-sigma factor family protein [Myceligenerans indicum]|uniref:Zf-HC2 domain-containing protein n=1 Tax=Myceligenerans indicum TaxID=2593663 RepID=A0ABS1LJC4_9MICO|nr:zf-HC2 domain-containing protein [Myceligenerans indicum]MBL0886268.1 zf-HC2 domain-containing protein [Myceligenerans indicum]
MTDETGPRHEEFADWDAAYVLGALTAADRRAFAEHLDECARCRTQVAELAPVPGLLRAAGGDGLGPRAVDTDGPATDLVDLVVRRRARRRGRSLLWGGAISAAAAAAVTVVVLNLPPGGSAPAVLPAETVGLVASGQSRLSANVELTDKKWGTQLTMVCTYAPDPATYVPGAGSPAKRAYALVVTSGDGATSQVSTWTAAPGSTVRLDAATALTRDDIAAISVYSADDATDPLLSADLEDGAGDAG